MKTNTTNTYTVSADSCNALKIQVSFTTSWNRACWVYNILRQAFRDVNMTDGETGEVMFSQYASDQCFNPTMTIAEALEQLTILEDMGE